MRTLPACLIALFAANACSDSTTPVDKTFDNPIGLYQSTMVAVTGVGEGGMSVTPKAIPEGYFTADIKIRLRNAKPNTTYTVQRAPEIGRALASNGVCERALGLAPWSSADTPAAGFITFNAPGSTAPATFMTTASGDGTLDFQFAAPTILKDTRFDVMFRLLDDTSAPTAVILSQCVTVTVI
jgi:hypothetical protein